MLRQWCYFYAVVLCLLIDCARAVEIAAHRGGLALTPENTLSAFQACAGYAEWIEFDVYVTLDGQLVVIHDYTVDRTTDGTGVVGDMTLAQIKALDAGSKFSPAFAGEPIPTLAEALQAMPAGIRPMIERKSGSADAIISAILESGLEASALLSAFDWNFLAEVHSKNPRIALSAIGSGLLTTNMLTSIQSVGAYSIAWEKSTITPSLIDTAHTNGIRVFAWSLDGFEIRDFLGLGLDGIIVNDPRLAFLLCNETHPSTPQLANDIAAYWKLDESDTDLRMADVEGGTNGWFSGASSPPQRVPGANAGMRGATQLDGVQNYIAIPSTPRTDIGTNAVSLSLWVNLAVLPSGISEEFAGIYDAEEDAYIVYLDRAARELRFKLTDAALQVTRIGIPEVQLGTGIWHHVAAVYDGSASTAAGQAMIYLDGRLISVSTGSTATPRYGLVGNVRSGQWAAIGRNGRGNAYYFSGQVDDVALWSRALLPAEIRHIHASGISGTSLESLIMAMQITGLDTASSQPELRFNVTHAIASDRQFRLGYATNPAGPYSEQSSSFILDGETVRCLIPTNGASGSTARFYRIESP